MAKQSLIAGGTSGAKQAGGSLEEFISTNFHFDADSQARLLELCVPCDHWLNQFEAGMVEIVDSPSTAILMALEGSANRFLRNKATPARVPEQRSYLQALDLHSGALLELLTLHHRIDGTTADMARFMRKAYADRGEPEQAAVQEDIIRKTLLTLKMFARYKLQRNVEPEPYEEREQKFKRRSTYRRSILIADLLATFRRITGEEPTAYVDENAPSRRVSKAIEFIGTALPPIFKAARLDWPPMSDESIKREIIDIKKLWAEGLLPELDYALPNWGRRFEAKRSR